MTESNSTTTGHEKQDPNFPRKYLISERILACFTVCSWARAYTGLNPESQLSLLFIVNCKRWSCPVCARQKVRQLAAQTKLANPNRLLTLTVDPSLYDGPRQAFDRTTACVPELIRYLRTRFGEVEYLRVTEVTAKGFPHYHLLLRSGFLPHAVVKACWEKYTSAKIVDLRQVKNYFNAYTYLVKYLTKLHKLDWTERHVSYSRGFFPETEKPEHVKLALVGAELHADHPWSYLVKHYRGQTLQQLSPVCWQLPDQPNPQESTPDLKSMELPIPMSPPPPSQQRLDYEPHA